MKGDPQKDVDLGEVVIKSDYFELKDDTLVIWNGPLAKAIDKLLGEASKESTSVEGNVRIKADVFW